VVLAGRPEPLRLAVGPPEQPEETDGSEATAADPAGDPAAAAPVETLYLGVDGQLVTTRAALTEHAERPVEDWRSKDLVAGEVYELARVEIEDAEGSTELRRVDSEWLRDGEPIDYGVATDLLYEISGGRAERVVTAASVEAAGEPVLTVRLIPEAGDGGGEVEPEVLRLYAARDGETPARVTDRDAVLVLSAETAGGIREKLAAVRSAPVEEPPEEEGSETDGEAGGGPDGTERESGGGGGTG
jgi:hypothetical protein